MTNATCSSEMVDSQAWSSVVLRAIPNEKELLLWAGYRWNGCCPSLQRGYLRMVVRKMAAEVPPHCAELVRILGFRPGRVCPGINSVVAQ
eukprot:1261396-Lingulodinium_polyedra.AAC.1